jgi:hypothetical protein
LTLKKISKLALLAAFSCSTMNTSFATTTYDVAGVYHTIPGSDHNWLARNGHETPGSRAGELGDQLAKTGVTPDHKGL